MRRILGVVAVAVLMALVPSPARAEDPPLVNWPALLPSLATGFTPATFTECADGAPECLQRTLAEMERRVAVHDRDCSDNALFARNYTVVTRFYEKLAGTGFFEDDVYVAREDVVFAKLYFDAEDHWRAGRHDRVPEAWRIAFDAADKKQVQGAGNLLLGINGHVQRDQPFMIAGLGLVAPDGRSRKPDHDKFNELLNAAYDDVIAEAARRDDPTIDDTDAPGTQADNLALFQMIAGWREGVWRNAERLVAARTDAERALVAASIEQNAAEWARRIRDTFTYRPPFDRKERDALCPDRRRRGEATLARLAAEERTSSTRTNPTASTRRRGAARQRPAAKKRAAAKRRAAAEKRAAAKRRAAARKRAAASKRCAAAKRRASARKRRAAARRCAAAERRAAARKRRS